MSNDTGSRENIAPEEAARIVASLLDQEQGLEAFVRFQRLLPPDRAEVFTQLSDEHREHLTANLSSAGMVSLIEHLDTDEAIAFAELVGQSSLPGILDVVSPDRFGGCTERHGRRRRGQDHQSDGDRHRGRYSSRIC